MNNSFLKPFSTWPVLLFGLALRVVNIDAPVIGVHSWRQADTAAIARNFLNNNLVFWQPQVDWAGATNGFVECEFPLYQYIVALLYKVLSFNEIYARSFSIICSCLTILLVFRIGKLLFNERIGWWGCFFYAILPLTVFYGRTIQPEPLMMFLAALSLERWISYLKYKNPQTLIISWICFTLATLIKVLPFFWVGIPIFFTAYQKGILFKSKIILLPLISIAITSIWYYHSYNLGQESGLTFGLWSGDTDRYSWGTLFEYKYYLDLIFRIIVRNFLVLGLVLLWIGCEQIEATNICIIGIFSVLFTGLINPVSFGVHEYYQLPMMLYACPLMGKGLVTLKVRFSSRFNLLPTILIIFLSISSTLMLNIDYWQLEQKQNQEVWYNSEFIINNTLPDDKIVSITGGDPTLLYLTDRKGWLASPEEVNESSIDNWRAKGAKYIVGSWNIVESYRQFDADKKRDLRGLLCASDSLIKANDLNSPSCIEDFPFYVIKL